MGEAERDGTGEELRMLYRLEAGTIESVKRNQWIVLFYGFLIYVLILLAARPLTDGRDLLRLAIVSVFSLMVLVFSLWFLAATKRHLSAIRGTLSEISSQFSESFRRLSLGDPHAHRRDDTPLLIFFAGLLTGGWFITNMLLYELDPVVLFIFLAFSIYIWLVSIITLLSIS